MSDKFQNRFRIPSARADWWDYGWNAAYFVTICTAHREHYFGEIVNDENIVKTGHCPVSTNVMQLSEIGQSADKFWRSITDVFPFVKLDVFVVMPNHIHGILVIDKSVETGHRPVSITVADNIVETGHCPVSINGDDNTETRQCLVSTNNSATEQKTPGELRIRNQGKGTLSSIIGSYKSIVSKHAHKIHADFEWQGRFYDHIIRDEEEFGRIANYIENNIANWSEDPFYK